MGVAGVNDGADYSLKTWTAEPVQAYSAVYAWKVYGRSLTNNPSHVHSCKYYHFTHGPDSRTPTDSQTTRDYAYCGPKNTGQMGYDYASQAWRKPPQFYSLMGPFSRDDNSAGNPNNPLKYCFLSSTDVPEAEWASNNGMAPWRALQCKRMQTLNVCDECEVSPHDN